MMLRKFLSVFLVIFCSFPVLAESKKIVISATNWAPYTGENLNNGGFLTEICKEAFERVGYKTEFVFVPWKRAVKMTKIGVYHALLGASYSKKREKYFSYPKYHWKADVHFFVRKGDSIKYKKIEDLCHLRLGVFSGSFYIKRFESYKCFKIETVPTTQQNIKKLVLGRLDIIIDSKESVLFYLNKELRNFIKHVEPLYPPLETDKLYIVISKKIKKFKKVRDDFDKGIMLLKNDGSYNRVLKKH